MLLKWDSRRAIISWVTEINVWVTENTGKSRGYTERCCKYVTNPGYLNTIEDTSLNMFHCLLYCYTTVLFLIRFELNI